MDSNKHESFGVIKLPAFGIKKIWIRCLLSFVGNPFAGGLNQRMTKSNEWCTGILTGSWNDLILHKIILPYIILRKAGVSASKA